MTRWCGQRARTRTEVFRSSVIFLWKSIVCTHLRKGAGSRKSDRRHYVLYVVHVRTLGARRLRIVQKGNLEGQGREVEPHQDKYSGRRTRCTVRGLKGSIVFTRILGLGRLNNGLGRVFDQGLELRFGQWLYERIQRGTLALP